jgi:D-alanine-D-alanine ligase
VSRVAVLKGGRSLERQVSLRSGAQVEDALERLGHEVLPIDVGADLVDRLRAEGPDVAFVVLHGTDGEDGAIQELLEVLGIPYTGSRPAACRRSWNKIDAKFEMQRIGIPTPDFAWFSQAAFADLGAGRAVEAAADRLGTPLVVKPARQGSALGVRVVQDRAELPDALIAAFAYDSSVLLERYVDGRDLAVSVLDGEPLPVVEAIPAGDTGYDFEARYEIGRTHFECPARLQPESLERAHDLARRAWEALGCEGFARVDLLCDRVNSELTVLEVNVIPGLTETSLFPQAAEESGLSFDDVIARLVEHAHSATRTG